MNLLDPVRLTVRHYPGGLDAMALRLQKQPGTLERELRGAPGYKLGALDAAEIALLAQDARCEHALAYPNALAAALGGMLVMLPNDDGGDTSSARDVARLMRECADVVSAVVDAEADGTITARELRALERQWAEVVAAGQQLMQHMHARHAAHTAQHRAAVEAAR